MPSIKVRELIKTNEKEGWYLVRTLGSHRQFSHPSKPGVDIPPGTLNIILKQAGLKE